MCIHISVHAYSHNDWYLISRSSGHAILQGIYTHGIDYNLLHFDSGISAYIPVHRCQGYKLRTTFN